jgi:hypothetical protein
MSCGARGAASECLKALGKMIVTTFLDAAMLS